MRVCGACFWKCKGKYLGEEGIAYSQWYSENGGTLKMVHGALYVWSLKTDPYVNCLLMTHIVAKYLSTEICARSRDLVDLSSTAQLKWHSIVHALKAKNT